MYCIKKVLNHNTVLAGSTDGKKEFLIMGKGVGFGKKANDRMERNDDWSIYSLQADGAETETNTKEMVKKIDPIYLEISDKILDHAEEEFGPLDRSILFPMAEHIAFAVKRIKNNEAIHNPLTQDIKLLMYKEYKVAMLAVDLLKKTDHVVISEDEIGFIAMHVHSAIENGDDTKTMVIASAVRECITLIEQDTKRHIDTLTVSYNLMMNHIKYMVARALNNEDLKFDMNHYISQNMPQAYKTAEIVWRHLSKQLGMPLNENEIGYLAIHIARVYEQDEQKIELQSKNKN